METQASPTTQANGEGSVNPFSKPPGNFPEEPSGQGVHFQEEALLDFSKEPIFSDDDSFTRYEIPGMPESYISIRNSVTYQVSMGRTKFMIQERLITTQKGAEQVMRQQFDVMGFFLYKIENCICDFRIVDSRTKKTEQWNGNPKHARYILGSIKSEKLCQWISDKIDETLGWTMEAEEEEATFSQEA